MSSRLFQEIGKSGLVYSIYTFSSAFNDGGIFGLYAGTGEEQLAELVMPSAMNCNGSRRSRWMRPS